VAAKHDATIVCTYNLTHFSAASVIEVLRSHPVAIIGGIVHENPFYGSPEELLREIQQRRAGGCQGQAPVAVA
jgi:hypothetical protein